MTNKTSGDGEVAGFEAKLRIVIVGHVDHGKSTLIGRLFHDTDSLPEGKFEQIRAACEAEGMEFEFAFLLDALLEEQAQNITIDTTQLPFRTGRRECVIIDAPGHKEFLKNMVTGAASADAAILLIDAQEGIQEQSRRHANLLSMLGIRQVAVAVNKMDLVEYGRERFEEIRGEFGEFLGRLGIRPQHYIPISAKLGLNVARGSGQMPWYSGPTILEALDGFEAGGGGGKEEPLRFVLQDIYRFDERRILAGRVETGELRVGQEIAFWPDGKVSRVRSIESWGARSCSEKAVAGQSVAITLEEQIFVERGQVGSDREHPPAEGRELHGSIFWLGSEPLEVERPFTLKLVTQSVEARVVEILRALDSSTLEPLVGERGAIYKNEVADVRIRTRRPVAYDRHDRVGATGRFVIVTGKRIGGGGIIREAEYESARTSVASDYLTWTVSPVTREARMELLGHRGGVIWLTGLSGSGKSTLSIGLDWLLHRRGIASTILDGDNLRHGLCSNLGFSQEDRSENIRRAGETAKLLAEAGLVVICSLISPFRADRRRVREICERDGIPFAEVYVNAPLEVCESRDPRGLYRRARAGEIREFTGIGSPYEQPDSPELELRTAEMSREECLERLLAFALSLARPVPRQGIGQVHPGEGI